MTTKRVGKLACTVLTTLLLTAVPSLASKIKLHVKVLTVLPASTTTYTWTTPGYGSANCYGGAGQANCTATAMPATTHVRELTAYQVGLQLPDGRIVIAECEKKLNWTEWSTSPYRNCRRPEPGEADAEFNVDNVKIVQRIRKPSIDNSGGVKTISETYKIAYVLEPSAQQSPPKPK